MATEDFNSVQTIEMSTFDSTGLTGTFAPLNGTGTSDDAKILRIINDSSESVIISYDGSTDADILLTKTSQLYGFQENASSTPENSGTLNVRKGQIIYGRGTPGTGNIYISGYR